jgi:hypothetical protein
MILRAVGTDPVNDTLSTPGCCSAWGENEEWGKQMVGKKVHE